MDTPVKLELDGLSGLDRDDLEALLILSGSGAMPGDYEFLERAAANADRAQDFGFRLLWSQWDDDWMFASSREKGRIPRAASTCGMGSTTSVLLPSQQA
jgi:hypothetical protein